MKRSILIAIALIFGLGLLFLLQGFHDRGRAGEPSQTAQDDRSPRQDGQASFVVVGEPVLALPAIDLAAAEQDMREREELGVHRFATPVEVDLHPDNAGVWTRLEDGRERWELTLESPNAVSLNFGFARYHMPAGGELILLDDAGWQPWRSFTAADNEAHGELWTPIVAGAAATLRVTLPQGARDGLLLQLASVNQGFRGWKKIDHGKIGGDTSGSCNIDVVCDANDLATIGPLIEPFRDQIRSVGAYTLNGIDTCSGALIANTSGDSKPYFLTADHCGVSSGNASSMICYWNFENPGCRAPGSSASGSAGNGPLNQFNSGAIFRADYTPSDMTLVEFDDPINPAHNLFFSGWDRSGNNAATSTGIHHPAVAEKRISFELQPTSITSYFGTNSPGDNSHLRVADWDHGTTEGGSSGSPLFDENKRIIGQLHGGNAACGNDEPDWYGRVFTSWEGGGSPSTRLRDWLDPINSGVVSLDGRNNDETLSIADASITEGDAGTSIMSFPITLNPASMQQVSFEVFTQNGSASAPADFNGFTAFPVVLQPGQTQQVIHVAISGDTVAESNETFTVRLQNPVNAVISDGVAVGTILNDDFDQAPVVTSPLTAYGLENTPFTYQITAQNTPTSFAIGNAPAGMVVDGSTGLVQWPNPVEGTYTFQIQAANPAGGTSETVMISVAPDSLLTAVDNDSLTIESGSDWVLQTNVTHDGIDAAQSGLITHTQTSQVSFVITGPDELTFWWKVSSEQGYDFLRSNLDGTQQGQISGEVDWMPGNVTIPAGVHTVSFEYVKDTSVSLGQDAGFIDELLLSSQSPAPIITGARDASGLQDIPFNLQISATGNPTSFSATNLPPGLAINNNGLISGFPSVQGVYPVGLVASNAFGVGTRKIVVTIFSPVEEGADTVGLNWTVIGIKPWYTQTNTTHDGVDAVQSGEIGDGEFSQMGVTVQGPGTFSWWWQVSSESGFDTLQVAVDGVVQSNLTLSGAVAWKQEVLVIPVGFHQVSWTYSKDGGVSVGDDAGWVDEVSFVSANRLIGDAVDAPDLEWMTGGDTAWFAQTTTSHDGIDAAQSGAIGDNQRSWLQTSVQGPGSVQFWWRNDSASGDGLQFMLNAVAATNLSGTTTWQLVELPLVPGFNSLRWDYVKDGATTNGTDAAWLDAVSLGGYAGWIDQSLGTAAVFSADPDGNGLSNLSEYGLTDIVNGQFTSEFFMVEMPKPSWNPIGLIYHLELADDLVLQNWSTNNTEMMEDTATFFRARDVRPAGSLLQQFFRIRVEPAP